MGFFDVCLVCIGAVAGSDLAVQYAPASLDFSSLPVRKYAGAIGGGYLTFQFVAPKKEAKKAAI